MRGDEPTAPDRFPATKFTPPALPTGAINRRAAVRLDEGADRPVTVLRAFPGAGKTALVAEWAARWAAAAPDARAVAWVSCDDGDRDPRVLWWALVVALQEAIGLDTASLPAEDGAWIPEHTAALVVNELVGNPGELVVVVDEAERAGDAISTLGPLVERIPPGVHLVFTTRVELPLPLQQLRVRRLLWELHQSDLALTFDESRELLGVAGLTVDATSLERIHEQTEGWLGSYVLVPPGSNGAADAFMRLGSRDGAKILTPQLEQFFRATLAAQRPALRNFLLDLALLDDCTAASSRAIIDRDAGDDLLRDAESQGLFIVPADGGGGYRIHRLFQQFLLHERKGRDVSNDEEVHRRAAEWHATNGDMRRSVRHYIAAGDVIGALRPLGSLMRSSGVMCGDGGLAGWVAEIDGDAVRAWNSPEATALYALALVVVGRTMRAQQWLAALDRMAGAEDPQVQELRSFAWMGLCWQLGDARAARQHRSQMHELQDGSHRWPGPLETFLSVDISTWLDAAAAARREYEAYEGRLGVADSSSVESVFVACAYANSAATAGDLLTAQSTADVAVTRARELGMTEQWPVASALRALGIVAYEQGRLVDARSFLSQAAERAAGRAPSAVLLSNVALARVHLALGNVEDTLRAIKRATSVMPSEIESPLRDLAVSVDIRTALALGDIGRARDLVEHVRTPWRASMLRARVCLETGELDEVERQLEGDQVPDTKRARLDLCLLRARLARKRKDTPLATQFLDEALQLAIPEVAVRPFFEDGLELWPMLRQALSSRSHQRFHAAASEMEQHCRSLRQHRTQLPDGAGGSVLTSLRPREMEVLRLIGQGLSNAEIAAMLYISPNTLKTHTRGLYRKLGVTRRSEAIAIAERFSTF